MGAATPSAHMPRRRAGPTLLWHACPGKRGGVYMFMVLRAVYEQDPKCGIPVDLIAILTYKGLSARDQRCYVCSQHHFSHRLISDQQSQSATSTSSHHGHNLPYRRGAHIIARHHRTGQPLGTFLHPFMNHPGAQTEPADLDLRRAGRPTPPPRSRSSSCSTSSAAAPRASGARPALASA